VYGQSEVSDTEQAAAPIIPPPPEELRRLAAAARIGDIMGLRQGLQRLETLSPEYAGFVAALRPLVKQLQLNAIRTLLEQYQYVTTRAVPLESSSR